jgi:hypothetical protein
VLFAIVLLLQTVRYGKEPLFDSIGQITILVFLRRPETMLLETERNALTTFVTLEMMTYQDIES